jgi:hypothetical protein
MEVIEDSAISEESTRWKWHGFPPLHDHASRGEHTSPVHPCFRRALPQSNQQVINLLYLSDFCVSISTGRVGYSRPDLSLETEGC